MSRCPVFNTEAVARPVVMPLPRYTKIVSPAVDADTALASGVLNGDWD